MSPDVLIEAVKVKAPVVNVNVQVTRTEPDLVPFGLLYIRLKGNDFMVPILKPLPDHFPCSLLKDISFLFCIGRHLSFFRRLL